MFFCFKLWRLLQIFRRRLPEPSAALFWRALCWLPFVLALSAVAALGIGGRIGHGLEFIPALGLLGAGWFAGRRLWPLSLITLIFLAPAGYQLAVLQPRAAEELGRSPAGAYLRVRGTVRRQSPRVPARGERVWLLLGEVEVRTGGVQWLLPEVEVAYPARGRRRRPLPFGREIRIGGVLRGVGQDGTRIQIELEGVERHLAARPIEPWRGETLRMALRNRAGYYLSEPALAVYLPILLGVRERASPEAQSVVNSFRRVGISHLFAISGLHIGLLLLIFLAAIQLVGGLLLRGQGLLHGRAAARVAAVALVWGYIALIGFPVPAARAAIMATMLLWSGLWGTRTPPLYLLWLAGLVLVGVTPSVVNNLSFQFSFLSFFFLLIALQLWERLRGQWRMEKELEVAQKSSQGSFLRRLAGAVLGTNSSWLARGLSLSALNLTITFSITAGIWPLVAIHFGQISLLVFLGNLLMIPLLSLVVLPGGLVALVTSMAHLGAVPGGLAERIVFGAMEGILQGWLWAVRAIEGAGGSLVFPVRLDWGARQLFFYYALLGGLILLVRYLGRAGRAGIIFNRLFSFNILKNRRFRGFS